MRISEEGVPPSLGPEQHPDRAPMHPQLPRDRMDTGSLSVQPPHPLVPGLPPLIPKLDLRGAIGDRDTNLRGCDGFCRCVDSTDRPPQACLLIVEESLDRLCHIQTQMPAVGNLNG